jgi:hypothetical protein
MNDRYKRAGQSTWKMADKRHKVRVWLVLVMGGATLLMLIALFKPSALGIGGLGIVGLIVVARLIIDYTEAADDEMEGKEYRAIRGAEAEERIGSILDTLGDDYRVVHDVATPHGNIDHVVIAKHGGVFLIETKAHGGRVSAENGRLLLNGHEPEKDFIAQVLKNTYWLRERIREASGLTVWIIAIIAFTNAFVEPMAPIKGVRVMNKKYLLNALCQSSGRSQNRAAWEHRDEIIKAL